MARAEKFTRTVVEASGGEERMSLKIRFRLGEQFKSPRSSE
jgi:hypothetical protein